MAILLSTMDIYHPQLRCTITDVSTITVKRSFIYLFFSIDFTIGSGFLCIDLLLCQGAAKTSPVTDSDKLLKISNNSDCTVSANVLD